MTLHIETPIYENPDLNKRLNKRIFLKMECYQPVGSFKIRGIGALCEQAVAAGKTHLISSSGGNAGYAAAYAGKRLAVKVTVVVPQSTSDTAKERILGEDAEVIVKGAMWDGADSYARQLVEETGGAYIHPFDDARVWTGHATMIDEAVRQCPFKPDALAVCVGGGGLMSGIIEGMQRNNWQDVPVLALETEGADSFAQSIQAGDLVRLEQITSIATTLGAAQVTPKTMEWSQQHEIIPIVVSDRDAVSACLQFADALRVLVEPSCGATLSLLYNQSHHLENYESVLVIVCGGAGVTLAQLKAWDESL
ncbi:MAG: pyridoxal-phosphate dependent enzyme [Anaerolineae bacterium]|nr:pyridoxal-phosphate dependent enzyme [Anaerolineae bacterium]